MREPAPNYTTEETLGASTRELLNHLYAIGGVALAIVVVYCLVGAMTSPKEGNDD